MNLDSLKYILTKKDYNELKYACISVVVLIVIIYMNAFENNNYTCKNILVNTYLYVLVSLVLFHIITMLLVNAELHIKLFSLLQSFNIYIILITLIAIIIGLIFIFTMSHTNILASHIILLILISLFSLLISVTYTRLKKQNLYNTVFYTTLLFISVLLIIFYFNQDIIKQYLTDEYYFIVFILLFVVFLVEIIYILFMGYSKNSTILISAIVLVIFGYFLLADTQKILDITEDNCKIALKNCNKNMYDPKCNIDDYPSYPQKSFDIFHDIIVIFRRIAEIYLATNSDE